MHKASDAGHIEPQPCGIALALAIGRRHVPPPEAQKRLFFEECSMCIKHRKYRQKWPWGGPSLAQGRNPKTAKHHLQMDFLMIFLIIFEVAFFNVKIEARAKNIVNTVKK